LAAALLFGLGSLFVSAQDDRPAGTSPLPAEAGGAPAAPAPEQGPAQVTITEAALAVPPGGFPASAGSLLIDVNGVKHFQCEEYGRKTKITDDPQNGITIEYTQKQGGTDETKKYEAKDAKELETKHPEGHKLYQQYLGNQPGGPVPGQVIIQAQGALLPPAPGQLPGPIPGQLPLPGPFPMPGDGAGVVQVIPGPFALPPGQSLPIEAAAGVMGQLSQDLSSALKDGAWKDAPQEAKAALKKQAAELKRQLLEIEKLFADK